MRYCILLLVLLTQSKHEDENSLAKYSYYFYGFTDECKYFGNDKKCRVIGATGFLLKKNENLYLVTAAHSLFNLQHENQEPLKYKYPTKFFLKLNLKGSNAPMSFPFDVSLQHPPNNYFSNHSDVYCFKIDIPDKYQVYSIESLIDEKHYHNALKGVMYGYPDIGIFNLDMEPSKATFDVSTYLRTLNITENKEESQAGLKQLSGDAGKGDSGAPLFLILNSSNVVFGGMCIASHNDEVIFVRPNNILKELP
jgi:hypothetical protein